MRKVEGFGPRRAQIMIVGEAPGEDEELHGKPFVGASGKLLDTLLREAGIRRDECYVTNVCKYRPPGNKIEKWITDKKKVAAENDWPEMCGRFYSSEIEEGMDELKDEIYQVQPQVIIGLGNVALWALTGEWGITDWRGSEMIASIKGEDYHFVPTLHPAAVLRSWPTRAFVAHDLKMRVARRLQNGFVTPEWDFNWTPTLRDALNFIANLDGPVAVDVETSRGQIVCVGLATSATRAMCIPFISEGYGAYWSQEHRNLLLFALKEKLTSISTGDRTKLQL